MDFAIQKLTQAHAIEISDCWKYDGEYAFYDMTADLEDYREFTDETLRNKNDHYEVLVNEMLAGFFCVIQDENCIELGLGMRPDLCGKGRGKTFLNQVLTFVKEHYQYEECILSVAVFNQRAISVYRSCGFKDDGTELRHTNGGIYEFLKMKKKRENSEKNY